MRNFTSIDEFVAFLATRPAALEDGQRHGLDVAGRIIATEARAEIGVPQPETGPFQAWEPLSEATMKGFEHPEAGWITGKEDLGYVGRRSDQDPLFRTGELEASYSHEVESPTRVVIGSTSEIAVFQELGTPNADYPIPPRSVLGAAAFRKGEEAVKAIANEVLTALAGERRNTWTG